MCGLEAPVNRFAFRKDIEILCIEAMMYKFETIYPSE